MYAHAAAHAQYLCAESHTLDIENEFDQFIT